MSGEELPIVVKASESKLTSYSLFSSDNPGSMISAVQLTGDNYAEWAVEMMNALRAKRKLGFVDGSIKQPAETEPDFESWTSVNSMVIGWLRTSIAPRVRSTVSFCSDAAGLWENLKRRFSVGNKVRIHQLVAQLASCKQEGQSVLEYYGRLTVLWDELQNYRPLPVCTCGAGDTIAKEREDEKVHQFVMGLDESRFSSVISQIVDTDPIPDLAQTYAKVIREEQRLTASKKREQHNDAIGFTTRRDLTPNDSPSLVSVREAGDASGFVTRSSNFQGGNDRNRERRFLCAHCGKSGHEKEFCWQLIGYPEWWTERNNKNSGRGSGRGGGRSSSLRPPARGRGYATVAHATSPHASVIPSLTPDQWRVIGDGAAKDKSQPRQTLW